MIYTFDTALQSLMKYPLPLERGIDCKILKGFGNKLCKMLDVKLTQSKLNSSNQTNSMTKINNCQLRKSQEDTGKNILSLVTVMIDMPEYTDFR